MRNLKRALSLTLASVMLLGMMVVGAGAAGYPDVDGDDNVEAIEVLQTIQVMQGNADNGNFEPDRSVTRTEMAVVMALLLNYDYQYYEASCPFWDVPTWAKPYVGACYTNKIVAGYGDGTYGALDPVTPVQAASMMMRALGYFQNAEDYADGFETATVRQGSQIGIFNGVGSSATADMTRNQVAQMALNALESEMVSFTGTPGTTYTSASGETLSIGYRAEYTPRTSTESKYQAIESRTSDVYGSDNLNRGQYYIQLGEELYNGDLKLRNHTLDDFGRPARTWEYKGSEIGTYAKKELLVTEPVTVGIKGSEVYALLGQNTIRENDLDVYVDGYLNGHNNDATGNVKKDDLVRSNNRNLNSTGNGVLTEIYLDNDLELITIVSINTYLAQANADYNENTETVSLTVYNDVNGNGYTKVVDVEDVPEIVDLKKDDWVLVNWADRDAAASSKVVVNMLDVEIMVDKTVTGFSSSTEDYTNWNQVSSDSRKVTEITTDGETYKNNVNAYYAAGTLNNYSDDRLVNKTYNIFMDQYGYFIGAELYSGQDQYVFITGYDRPTSAIGVSTATARAIFADGTMDTIQVNVKDTNTNIGATAGYTQWTADEAQEEMWYRYSENRGVYTLSPVEGWTRTVADTNDVVIDCSNVRLVPTAAVSPATNGTGNSYGEDDSIYITVEYGDVDSDQHGNTTGVTDVTGVYTGVQSVKLIRQQGQWAHAVYDRNNNFIVACVVLGEAEGVVDNYAYIRSGAKNERYVLDTTSRDSGDRTFYWDVDVVMNGEATTKTIKSKYSNTTSQLVPGTVQELVLDADGYVTKINPLNNSLSGTPAVEGDDPQGSTAKKDEVYSNHDFINNGVNNTEANGYNSTDLADYSVYDINVSDKAFNDAVRAQNDQGIGAKGQQDWGYYSNLALQGNTLIFDASLLDKGLPIKNGAKAVVYHWVKNEQKYEDYTSVSAAFNALNDADGESSTNTVNLKQFSGRVIAVLNSNGQAEWVLFIDNTPENVKDPGYGSGSITGEVQRANIGLQKVNELLYSGEDVIIDGSWRPEDLSATNNILYLPNNRTLTILGDFNTYHNDGTNNINIQRSSLTSGTVGKIVVGSATGTAAAQNARFTAIQNIDFQVEARNMTIGQDDGQNKTISERVTVTNNLRLENVDVTVSSTLNAGDITRQGSSEDLYITGTVTVNNLQVPTGVYSWNTLIVTGAVDGNVTVTVGDSTRSGRAVINTVTSGSQVIINNANAATVATTVETNNGTVTVTKGVAEVSENKGTAKAGTNGTLTITTVSDGTVGEDSNNGTITVTNMTGGTIKAGSVTNVGADATISLNGGTVRVTGTLDTGDVTISGGNLVLAAGVTIGENASVVEGESTKEVTGTITTETTLGSSEETSGTLKIPADNATTEAKNLFANQPTGNDLLNALEDWACLASVISTTTATYTDGTGTGSSSDAPAGTVTLSGKVTPVTTMNQAQMEAYTGSAISDWNTFISDTSSDAPGGYGLKDGENLKNFGFVIVQMEGGEIYVLMVEQQANGSWQIVIRPSSGAKSLYSNRTLNFGLNESNAWYTVDVSGLS